MLSLMIRMTSVFGPVARKDPHRLLSQFAVPSSFSPQETRGAETGKLASEKILDRRGMFRRAKMPIKAAIRDGDEDDADEERHNSMGKQKAEKTEKKHKERDAKNPEADRFLASDECIIMHFPPLLWFLCLPICFLTRRNRKEASLLTSKHISHPIDVHDCFRDITASTVGLSVQREQSGAPHSLLAF